MADFSVGEDFQATITGPFGSLQLDKETGFSYEQITTVEQVAALDGLTYRRVIFGEWTGSITLARDSNVLDTLAQQIQDTSLADGVIPDGSILTQIYEQDGSKSTYTFNNVVYQIKKLGDWQAKKTVMQTLMFFAQTRT